MPAIRFPDNFLWGTASSAYQVEGGNDNTDWHRMEQQELAKPPGRRRIREACGQVCDHWNRYGQDFDLARQLNVQIHRMSVEWSRIVPAPDRVDHGALEHYRGMLAVLRERGIRTMLCLHHFTIPVFRTFLAMHARAFRTIKRHIPHRPVGVAYAWLHVRPYNPGSPLDRLGAWLADRTVNRSFFRSVCSGRIGAPLGLWDRLYGLKGSLDFAGVNYYNPRYFVQAYMHGSLTDNFEWAKGFSMRFGLIQVDYPTQERTIKWGGHWYAQTIKQNGIEYAESGERP